MGWKLRSGLPLLIAMALLAWGCGPADADSIGDRIEGVGGNGGDDDANGNGGDDDGRGGDDDANGNGGRDDGDDGANGVGGDDGNDDGKKDEPLPPKKNHGDDDGNGNGNGKKDKPLPPKKDHGDESNGDDGNGGTGGKDKDGDDGNGGAGGFCQSVEAEFEKEALMPLLCLPNTPPEQPVVEAYRYTVRNLTDGPVQAVIDHIFDDQEFGVLICPVPDEPGVCFAAAEPSPACFISIEAGETFSCVTTFEIGTRSEIPFEATSTSEATIFNECSAIDLVERETVRVTDECKNK